jgi:hypothetical protein
MQALRDVSRKTAAAGLPPERAAEVIVRAMKAPRLRTSYTIGFDARAQSALSRILPARALDAVIARYMGLHRLRAGEPERQ